MNFLDLFSGIGGFALGFEQSGYKFDYHGFSEIDKFATELYKRRFPNATELGSITDVQCEQLPEHIDILCGGFPCQSFSMAGKRGGFNDTRGTLFFEIARILRHFRSTEKPIPHFVLENVKGLLNHDDGRTFALIYRVLTDLDYSVECQLLNTRWFLPQNRERIYIVGHFRGEPRSKIFPIGSIDEKDNESRTDNITTTITSRYFASTSQGSYIAECDKVSKERKKVKVSNASPREFGWRDESPALLSRDYKDPKIIKVADYRTDEGIRVRKDGNSPTLTASHHSESEPSRMQGLVIGEKIRRLSCLECERLQGFPDGWTEGQSDTQRYKQLGNAVSVPVVKEIAKRLKPLCL